MTKARLFLSAALATMSLAGAAQAAPTVVAFNLTALFPVGSPVNPITGQFSVSFDNATDINATSAGLTVTGLNFTPDMPLMYAYSASDGSLTFGDFKISPGIFTLRPDHNDFGIYYRGLSNPRNAVAYSFSNQNFYASTAVVTTPLVASVPEPATWAMMIAGFGMVGFAMRRRQQVAVSNAA